MMNQNGKQYIGGKELRFKSTVAERLISVTLEYVGLDCRRTMNATHKYM